MEFNTIDMFVDFSVRNMVLDPDENSLMQASWNISFLSHEKDVYINFSSFNHYEILVKKLVSHIFHDGPFHTPCLKKGSRIWDAPLCNNSHHQDYSVLVGICYKPSLANLTPARSMTKYGRQHQTVKQFLLFLLFWSQRYSR